MSEWVRIKEMGPESILRWFPGILGVDVVVDKGMIEKWKFGGRFLAT